MRTVGKDEVIKRKCCKLENVLVRGHRWRGWMSVWRSW